MTKPAWMSDRDWEVANVAWPYEEGLSAAAVERLFKMPPDPRTTEIATLRAQLAAAQATIAEVGAHDFGDDYQAQCHKAEIDAILAASPEVKINHLCTEDGEVSVFIGLDMPFTGHELKKGDRAIIVRSEEGKHG